LDIIVPRYHCCKGISASTSIHPEAGRFLHNNSLSLSIYQSMGHHIPQLLDLNPPELKVSSTEKNITGRIIFRKKNST
jgi:hypothetical protein